MSSRYKRSTTYNQFQEAIKGLEKDALLEDDDDDLLRNQPLAHIFMRLWDSNEAAGALTYLKYMEIKARLRSLQQTHGCWRPPPEVANYLKKQPKPLTFSTQAKTKGERNLKFVLHILGVSPYDNKPFKEFLNAKTIRQKRYWLYKHMGPMLAPVKVYKEPICETRLKRLYHFFPNRFKDEDGVIYFNNKLLLYSEALHLFFFGTREYFDEELQDEPDSSEDLNLQVLTWRTD